MATLKITDCKLDDVFQLLSHQPTQPADAARLKKTSSSCKTKVGNLRWTWIVDRKKDTLDVKFRDEKLSKDETKNLVRTLDGINRILLNSNFKLDDYNKSDDVLKNVQRTYDYIKSRVDEFHRKNNRWWNLKYKWFTRRKVKAIFANVTTSFDALKARIRQDTIARLRARLQEYSDDSGAKRALLESTSAFLGAAMPRIQKLPQKDWADVTTKGQNLLKEVTGYFARTTLIEDLILRTPKITKANVTESAEEKEKEKDDMPPDLKAYLECLKELSKDPSQPSEDQNLIYEIMKLFGGVFGTYIHPEKKFRNDDGTVILYFTKPLEHRIKLSEETRKNFLGIASGLIENIDLTIGKDRHEKQVPIQAHFGLNSVEFHTGVRIFADFTLGTITGDLKKISWQPEQKKFILQIEVIKKTGIARLSPSQVFHSQTKEKFMYALNSNLKKVESNTNVTEPPK